jgi:hypothetical protein
MNPSQILYLLENLVFWALIITIAWMGKSAPPYVFMSLFVFIIYWGIRILISLQGLDRAIGIYTLNISVTIALLFYFSHK